MVEREIKILMVLFGALVICTICWCAIHYQWSGYTKKEYLKIKYHPNNLIINIKGNIKSKISRNYKVNNPTKTEQIYTKLLNLSMFPKRSISCGSNLGISVDLKFFQGKNKILNANADVTGCEAVHLENGIILRADKQFWNTIKKYTHIPIYHLAN